ncbi:tail completion protein [Streptomyces phage phiScoe10]|nr:tail completion protein [Streptomyces phage phiScoe10]
MAEIFDDVGKQTLEKFLGKNKGVQFALDNYTFEIAVRAEGFLQEHQDYDDDSDAHSKIDIERGEVDRYVVLNDDRGQKAAMSIEYGRAAGEKEVKDEDGNKKTVKWGASPGLYILARASNLPKKRKGKVRL